MPVVLYGCATWSLTLREKRRLRVFEKRVLRKILGPKRDEVIGEWRKLHKEEHNDLYCSPNIVRVVKSRMCWLWHVARMGKRRDMYRVLVGKPEGKTPLGRPRRRWEDDINPYPTAFPYGNGMVLHFYQQQESSTTKTVHRVINKGLKTYVLSLHTGEKFH